MKICIFVPYVHSLATGFLSRQGLGQAEELVLQLQSYIGATKTTVITSTELRGATLGKHMEQLLGCGMGQSYSFLGAPMGTAPRNVLEAVIALTEVLSRNEDKEIVLVIAHPDHFLPAGMVGRYCLHSCQSTWLPQHIVDPGDCVFIDLRTCRATYVGAPVLVLSEK